ncbi:hypothetical protein ACMU_06710 [Actibacterium mucosum KCTC 23349]|uniref:SPOR domain-containing protein n=1 Tax=Actibacterium mucosum KCTC 23349 TaxID=1454373 RepID=A0A037ZLV5_9RHOB|nr:SPOR domain-containing protein [Actibacterium mucosum]KAJ56629.1 hypothetical protein ACMU_06710 [Actibacterium mucosum KCTC 23349]
MAGYDEISEEFADAGPVNQAWMAWAGAATSVALLIGLGYWGYELTMRDVSGVPIVRAQDGPARIAPEDPGGSRMVHQGLAVNNVAAVGTAADPANRLLLAPRPVDLQPDDEAGLETATAAPVTEEQTADQQVAAADPIVAPAPIDTDQPAATPAVPLATPVVASAPAPTTTAIPASVPGLRKSLRPQPRPKVDLVARAAAAAAASALSVPAINSSVEVASVAAGSNLVQLGAFDSPEVARAEWDRLSQRFDSLLADKKRLVQTAVRGGRTFYRLRAVGFSDISAARRFCAALTAEKALCVPVVAR